MGQAGFEVIDEEICRRRGYAPHPRRNCADVTAGYGIVIVADRYAMAGKALDVQPVNPVARRVDFQPADAPSDGLTSKDDLGPEGIGVAGEVVLRLAVDHDVAAGERGER